MGTLARVTGMLAVAAVATACGGDDGGASISVASAEAEGGLVEVRDVSCSRDGDQMLASGVVSNEGDNPHYVSIGVRFVDGDGIRVELASDSISELNPGESAHWDVSIYGSGADTVVSCEVTAEAS